MSEVQKRTIDHDILVDATARSTRGHQVGKAQRPNFVVHAKVAAGKPAPVQENKTHVVIKHMIVQGFHEPNDDIDSVLYRGQHHAMFVRDLLGVFRQFRYRCDSETLLRAHAPLTEPCVWSVQGKFVKNGPSGQNAAPYFEKTHVYAPRKNWCGCSLNTTSGSLS